MKKKTLWILGLLLAGSWAGAQPFELEGNTLKLPSPITFQTGTAKLTPDSKKALAHIAAYLKDKTYITLMRIEGHTSTGISGSQELSEARALAVCNALVALGIEAKRLLPVGFGDTKPVASNSTAEGRSQNTRIEAVNAMLRNRAIGGMPVDGGGQISPDWK